MPVTIGGGLSFCGREVTPQELDLVRQVTREFCALSLTELAHTVCELLEWRRPNGSLKSRECYLFLQALHDRGGCPGYHGRKREYTAPGPSCSIVRVKCKVHSRARSAIIFLPTAGA